MSFSWFWSKKSSQANGRQSTPTSSSSVTRTVKTTFQNGHEQVLTTTTYSDRSHHQTHQAIRPQFQTVSPDAVKKFSSAAHQDASGGDATTVSQFESECLKAHNRYRSKHGCPPLQLSRELCSFATGWAKNIASRNCLQHRPNSSYGENLFMASGQVVSGDYVVKSWYDEIAKYRYGNAHFSSGTGHFTQVVWKNSTKLGIGFERRGNSTWVVANYDPPGNYQGQFQQNVPPPKA